MFVCDQEEYKFGLSVSIDLRYLSFLAVGTGRVSDETQYVKSSKVISGALVPPEREKVDCIELVLLKRNAGVSIAPRLRNDGANKLSKPFMVRGIASLYGTIFVTCMTCGFGCSRPTSRQYDDGCGPPAREHGHLQGGARRPDETRGTERDLQGGAQGHGHL
jgi:hypothetical protein